MTYQISDLLRLWRPGVYNYRLPSLIAIKGYKKNLEFWAKTRHKTENSNNATMPLTVSNPNGCYAVQNWYLVAPQKTLGWDITIQSMFITNLSLSSTYPITNGNKKVNNALWDKTRGNYWTIIQLTQHFKATHHTISSSWMNWYAVFQIYMLKAVLRS